MDKYRSQVGHPRLIYMTVKDLEPIYMPKASSARVLVCIKYHVHAYFGILWDLSQEIRSDHVTGAWQEVLPDQRDSLEQIQEREGKK